MIQPATSIPSVTTTSRFDDDFVEAAPATVSTERLLMAPRLASWSAIIAGAVSAIAIQILFAMLGTAIGLTVVGTADDAPEEGLSIAGAIYWLVTGLVSLFVGGMIAGRVRNTSRPGVAALHGFLSWCTVTVLSALMLALASGAAIGGSLSVVGNAMAVDNGRSKAPLVQTTERQPSTDTVDATGDAGRAANAHPLVTEEDAKDAAKQGAIASWWTLAALLLGAGVATIGGRSGVCNCKVQSSDRRSAADTARAVA